MISSRRKTTGGREYKVKDFSLADLGRREIELAQVEMPSLMACRDEFGPYKPLKGNRITVSSPVTARYAVFIETLIDLGGKVRWCSSDLSSTEDHAAAAVAYDSASVFAWKGQTPEECWWCTKRALDFGDGRGPDLIVDCGGKVTLLIDEGLKAEKIYAKTGELPDPSSTDNAELQVVLGIIRDGLKNDPMKFQSITEALVGVSIETASGVKTPYLQMKAQDDSSFEFPIINVNDSVTESKFNSLLGCRYGLLDGIRRSAENMKIHGKKAVVWGYDDARQGCAISLNQAGADLVVYEADPSPALQARLRGFKVIETLDDVVSEADIFVTNIHVADHVRKMKNNAIIYDTDTRKDHDNGYKQNCPDVKIFVVDPQTEKWVIPETKSSVTVLRNTAGYPNFMESWSCTSHMLAMLELWSNRGTVKYENKVVYDLPEHIEEKMAALHLSKLTAAAAPGVMVAKGKPNDEDEEFVQKKSDQMLLTVVKACSLLGMVAVGLMKASKVGKDVSFPKDPMDLPLSAIWDN